MSDAPPPEIAHFVAAIGPAATLLLIEMYGGTRLYFATGDRGETQLQRQLGKQAADALADICGRERLRVPLVKEWRARLYRGHGLSHSEIARKLGCTDKQVQRYLSPGRTPAAPGAIAAASAQMSLPLGFRPRAGA